MGGVDKPKRQNTIWDMQIERTAPYAADLAAFDKHKKALLDRLRNEYDRGLKSKPFDAENLGRDLTRVARLYLWRPTPGRTAADRVERLRDLARALGQARRKVYLAMQEDVGNDLFRAWFAGTKTPLASVFQDTELGSRIADQIKQAAVGLATLETAARRAADSVPTRRGRPKGTALPPDFIEGLAAVYRIGTGSKPGAGDGPFSKFVFEFLTACGSDIKHQSVIDAIKDTRALARMRPALTKSRPSPFDNQT